MTVGDILKDGSIWMPSKDYDTTTPKVTVVLPTYSRGKNGYFKRAVDSVLNQTFRRLELIIVDDCSTDGTFEQIKNYMKKDPRVSCIRHTYNIGLPAISQYEAYMKARGQFIAYIFDDNEWYPEAIAKTYDLMVMKDLKATFGITNIFDPETNSFIPFGDPQHTDLQYLPIQNLFGNGAVVFHRDVIETVGLYDPHLSLTRICDWDLWIRVSNVFNFYGTGVLFTREYGPALADSLGNQFKLNVWMAAEYQQHREEELLLPKIFHNANIIDIDKSRSRHYIDCMEAHIAQYTKKTWFDPNIVNTKSLSVCESHKRILVLTETVTASCMSFFRVNDNKITIRFINFLNFKRELGLADVLIVIRDSHIILQIKEIVKQCNIPAYFYLDDNYFEVARSSNDQNIQGLLQFITKENLEDLDGVILSSQELVNYFQAKKLHKNLVLMEPIIDPKMIRPLNIGGEVINFAFMGGTFRNNALNTCVLPALGELSKMQKIRLYCPMDENKELEKYRSERFEIIEIPRSLNLDYTLNTYGKYNINFLIHCGENVANNRYKTKNALINAVTLGSVLVVSDIEPYCFKDDAEPDDDYVITENSVNAWFETLKNLINSPERCVKIYNTSKAYCLERYGAERVWSSFTHEIEDKPGESYYKHIKQNEAVINYVLSNHFSLPHNTHNTNKYRSFVPESLCTSGRIRKSRKYGITCTVDTLREIGLLFAVFERTAGTLYIRLYRKGELLSSGQIDLDCIRQNGYTDIVLNQPVKGCFGKKIVLEMEIRYAEQRGHIEPFELRENRKFWYKVFNKLGCPLKGRDALFVDCRE